MVEPTDRLSIGRDGRVEGLPSDNSMLDAIQVDTTDTGASGFKLIRKRTFVMAEL